jgi:hypothetical protein
VSTAQEEVPITRRVSERPEIEPKKLREVHARDLAYRFAAGAVTSIVAGVMTLVFGPRIGGIMLAFPAILAASLTLIEEQEDSAEAREDARGAVIGALGMAAFAAVAAILFGAVNAAIVLLAATAAWFLAAFAGYMAAWFK